MLDARVDLIRGRRGKFLIEYSASRIRRQVRCEQLRSIRIEWYRSRCRLEGQLQLGNLIDHLVGKSPIHTTNTIILRSELVIRSSSKRLNLD